MFGRNTKTEKSTDPNVTKEKENRKKKKSRKDRKKEIRQKRSTQNVFRYRTMCEDGICELGNDIYSMSIGFSDIDYQIATEENQQVIFGKYQNILNSLGNDIDMCLTINNRLLDIKEFEENMLLKHAGDGKDFQRVIINDYILDNVKKGNNKITSEKMFTFSVREANIRDARRTLGNIASEFEKSFRDLKCETHIMDGVQRLSTLYSIVKPGEKFNFSFENLGIKETSKDYIAPYCFDFKESRDYFRIDSRYCKVLYLSSWASEMGDKLLYRLSNLEHNLTMTIHMKVVPRGKDKELIKTKLNALDKQIGNENRRNIKNMMDPDQIPVHLRMSYAGTTELLEEVSNRDQRMFYTSMFILINASSKEEMELITKDIKVICTQCDCEFAEMTLEQEDGFNAVLPLGNPKEELARLVTSKVCSILMPFTSKELMNPSHPVFYGVNQITSNMILCNRFYLETPSGWILGKPGQGKSFKVKQELTYIYLSDP
ncbi:MAG: hypothetical protein KBT48_09275, partial [Firmicutes bacterium]|nr:hypothetical protein [Bacillota bacterium]